MKSQEINRIDPLDIVATYKVGKYSVFFDAKDWTWRAINPFRIGVDSDLSVVLLLKRLIEE